MVRTIRLTRFGVVALVLVSRLAVCQEPSAQAVERLTENWRWSHYWFGKTGIDDAYTPGKRINALIFWTRKDRRPKNGLCSSDLSICVAYSGPYLSPHAERMQIGTKTPLQQAFTSFVSSGFGGDEEYIDPKERLRPADFESEEKVFTLPTLDMPSSISLRAVPEEASREAERVKRLLGCGPLEAKNLPNGCSGTLVFAFYGPTDPYWFVWRTCSARCEFRGDAIEELTRGDRGWEVTSGGFINSPKAEVDRLRQQIQKAEMFRVQL